MNNKEILKIIAYILIGILIIGVLIMTFFPGIIYAVKDGPGVSGKSGEEICKPQPGYTEESWREHMSHHPDIYRECLE